MSSHTPSMLLHTPGHVECPACERTWISAVHIALDPKMTFHQASSLWLESRNFGEGKMRARFLAPRTLQDYRSYVRMLNRFFAQIPLQSIHPGHMREYQLERAEQAGANKVNQEMATLIRVLRRANLWGREMQDAYESLQKPMVDTRRAMTPQEQEGLIATAASRDKHQLMYWYCLIALRTSANNKEMRYMRIGDVSLTEMRMRVQPGGAKNRFRVRTIALAPDAVWAAQQLIYRAQMLCDAELQPHHFIFPFREAVNCWNPERPMSCWGLVKPWNALRTEAQLPWLRIHDLRHSAITRLAEAGVPLSVIMSMAGHISPKMTQHYTTISDQAQRAAINAVFEHRTYQHKPPQSERPQPVQNFLLHSRK